MNEYKLIFYTNEVIDANLYDTSDGFLPAFFYLKNFQTVPVSPIKLMFADSATKMTSFCTMQCMAIEICQ